MKVTIIYDNTAFRADLKSNWGFAALVETYGRRILFDTGTRGAAVSFSQGGPGSELRRPGPHEQRDCLRARPDRLHGGQPSLECPDQAWPRIANRSGVALRTPADRGRETSQNAGQDTSQKVSLTGIPPTPSPFHPFIPPT